jgi:hypothetical protein
MVSRKSKPQDDVPLHLAKFTVWYAFSALGIVGPVFLQENMNSEICGDLLEEICIHFCKE